MHAWLACIVFISGGAFPAGFGPVVVAPRQIAELVPKATIHLGKTADWVVITPDAVWVGSTGPYAVHRIDPKTNQVAASVKLGGEPCAGMTAAFESLWVPLCGKVPGVARVDLKSNAVVATFKVGPAVGEGGITASADKVWLVLDNKGTLASIDPNGGQVNLLRVPPGSYNPRFYDGVLWVTRAKGAEVTAVDASNGKTLASIKTGPGPRFLTSGEGTVWTLNQGDGSLTRIDALTGKAQTTISLGTPGPGGDIALGGGMVWTTMPKIPLSAIDTRTNVVKCQWVGPGGDSLGIGHQSIWLTNYNAGTVARLDLNEALALCGAP